MAKKPISLPQQRDFLETKRRDTWWLFPAITFAYFMAFIIYSTWGAFQGEHYWFAGTTDGPGFAAAEHVFSADEATAVPGGGGFQSQYLSPFYAPTLFRLTHLDDEAIPGVPPVKHTWFGEWPDWLHAIWPPLMPLTPAVLILWAPGVFRFTCYYYRGAYYKAFWMDPVNCAVGEPRATYWGEFRLPLILQNIHRYFLYIALIFILILGYDAVISFIFVHPDGSWRLGVGVGSIVLLLNVVFLALYTFGCHSFRHLVGGIKDTLSASKPRYQMYKCASCMNRWHMQWAWISLFWVGFADVYVRLCSMGIWTDYRILL